MHTTVRDNSSESPSEQISPAPPAALPVRRLAPGTVRVGPYMTLPALLRELGVDPVGVIAEFGLQLSVFDESENTIAYSTAVKLIARCAELTGCKHFGLMLGQRVAPSAMGIVGYLVLHSPTVEIALQQLVDNMKLHGRGGSVRLAVYRDQAAISYAANVAPEYAEQITHGALAVAFNIMRSLCGDAWLPTEVRFALPAPKDVNAFKRFFRVPVHFDAEQSMLVFPKRWLASAVRGADPTLFHLLQVVADKFRRSYQDDVTGDVRRIIVEQLPTGKCSIELVADRLDLHPRTLNRRLREQGTSFINLLTEIRLETATHLLRDSGLSITRIGLMLGYTNSSSFTRSFERMTNRSPKAWRADQTAANRP